MDKFTKQYFSWIESLTKNMHFLVSHMYKERNTPTDFLMVYWVDLIPRLSM